MRLKQYNRDYYTKNKKRILLIRKSYYDIKKDDIKKKNLSYYHYNAERMKEYKKEYVSKNKEILKSKRREYYLSNKEELSRKANIYNNNNREKIKKYQDLYRIKIKEKVYNHYGYKCNCCGEKHKSFLQIDHVNNDGYITRKKYSTDSLLLHIIRNNFPDTFQILCANCNWSKRINHGICEHKI